eukprot:gb/GECG01014876.1/.p1 GENE.gb/GECG01014876.1/~~gb/GECG01014876.1/.p1  ORF type:complete len:295 (+),score=68.94 gb/GECG01014876.1/:1-885(+)
MAAARAMEQAKKEESRFSLFGRQEKYENAAELYERAGNTFRSENDYEQALYAFQKAVENWGKARDEKQVSTVQQKVAECQMKLMNLDDAQATYEEHVIPVLKEDGKITNIGKIYEKLAEAFHKEGQTGKAIEALQKASDVYENEEGSSGQRRAKARLAELLAQKAATDVDREGFMEATQAFQECGDICLEENLLRFNAKKYFFSAIICSLASGDAVAAQRLLDSSTEQDPNFGESREGKLCQTLLTAVNDKDVQSFVTAIHEHDRIAKLSDLETKILLVVKRDINEEDGLEDEL